MRLHFDCYRAAALAVATVAIAAIIGIASTAAPAPAEAHWDVRIGVPLGWNYPAYYGYGYYPYSYYPAYPAYPTYVAPAPVYAAPAPVYAAPAQTAVTPLAPANCKTVVTHAIIDGASQKMTGVACRQPDGTWRLN